MSAAKVKNLKRKRENDKNSTAKGKKAKISNVNQQESVPINETDDSHPQWNDFELLAEQQNLEIEIAKNVISLFEEGNTIPFIARYRKHVTKNMPPEALRDVKETYDEIISLKNKMTTVIKNLVKSQSLTDELRHKITYSRSIEELEYVYAPYKPGPKRTLAERAKESGLEAPALDILHNRKKINLEKFVQNNKKELSTIADVENGIIHVIASSIAVDTDILTNLRQLRKRSNFTIKTKIIASKQTAVDTSKFLNYDKFEIPIKYIKPHQILAINRGEHLKALTVQVVVPENIFNEFRKQCFVKWMYVDNNDKFRENIIKRAVEDSYKRLVRPLIIREIRSELKQQAEKASCASFGTNLKHLLLATPLKGKWILGIDPGFANGCKLALISPMGELVTHDVIYPHKQKNKEKDEREMREKLRNMLLEHNCELVALGNGTACRQTEEWLTRLIREKAFRPLDVKYTVVREEGASIYSCSAEAKEEFPELDPNIISAASLARRIQDPLAELVKVEPKHLGIGMYQHDIKKKRLEEVLDDVVSECVSFVGVDLNTASLSLLKHVAGISSKKAEKIIEYRTKNGPFVSRKQLLEVQGIGQVVFRQCAGFLRVGPLTSEDADFYNNSKTTKLDCTYIHPESYDVAKKIIKKLNLSLSDVGEAHFIESVKSAQLNMCKLNEELETDEQSLQLILDTLAKPVNYDLRNESPQEALFKKCVTKLEDLRIGAVLTGRVDNVTHFGSFVDIGVGVKGLIHISKYRGLELSIGKKVEVEVLNVEIEKKRISLGAIKLFE